MEIMADEKIRMVKKVRVAIEACEQQLKDKARDIAALEMERQRKKTQIDELERIMTLKQVEADTFELKAIEARHEAEKQYLFEKINFSIVQGLRRAVVECVNTPRRFMIISKTSSRMTILI